MAKKNKLFRQQVIPVAQQLIRMHWEWPGFSPSIRRGEVSWVGKLTPTAMSETYVVRVSYRAPERPIVDVLTPPLRCFPGKRIPHIFPGKKLCLHTNGQWMPNMFIANTIIGWAALWLFFYEAWLITGKWEGGGHEPRRGKESE
jgi:hypothetical protein